MAGSCLAVQEWNAGQNVPGHFRAAFQLAIAMHMNDNCLSNTWLW